MSSAVSEAMPEVYRYAPLNNLKIWELPSEQQAQVRQLAARCLEFQAHCGDRGIDCLIAHFGKQSFLSELEKQLLVTSEQYCCQR